MLVFTSNNLEFFIIYWKYNNEIMTLYSIQDVIMNYLCTVLLFLFQDLKSFMKDVPSVAYKYRVPEKDFCHLDYTLGIHAKSLVYDDILKQMKKLHHQ